MRLQLIASLIVTAAQFSALATATAQPVVQVDTRGSLYEDTDDTTIVTATAAVRATAFELLTVKGRYLADVISSASVDVVSAATPGFFEIRHEAEGQLVYADGTRTASGTYIYSYEPDWESHTIAAGFGHDFFDHQLTLGLAGNLVLNAVGRKDDETFEDKLTIGGGTASVALVATKNDLISIAYTLLYSEGYQSSPYRYAYLRDPAGTGFFIGVPESHPEKRTRHALAAQYNRYLFKESALRSHARGYIDDWGVKSITVGTEYVIGFSVMEAGIFVRGYFQSKAAFYEDVYDAPRRYMTADREMSRFLDGFGGVRLAYRQQFASFLDTLKAEVKFTGFGFKFFDFDRLPDRAGLTVDLGIGASF